MIEFQHVSKVYDSKTSGEEARALDDVTFAIEKGEFVFFVGPSGAGKSTLLRLLLREELPTEGEIRVGGKNLLRLRRRSIPRFRRLVGAIFQDGRLLDDRTVFDNVALALRVHGAARDDVLRRTQQALRAVGLLGKVRAFPWGLSGGEQQRVAIARALIREPVLLLADEPIGNLDEESTGEIMELLKVINARGTTVLVATHRQDLAARMRQRTIQLMAGRVVKDSAKRGERVSLEAV